MELTVQNESWVQGRHDIMWNGGVCNKESGGLLVKHTEENGKRSVTNVVLTRSWQTNHQISKDDKVELMKWQGRLKDINKLHWNIDKPCGWRYSLHCSMQNNTLKGARTQQRKRSAENSWISSIYASKRNHAKTLQGVSTQLSRWLWENYVI